MTTLSGVPGPVARGCGTRAAGGCYWELHAGPRGVPLETYLLDPPVLLGELVVPDRGVLLIERAGVTHVVDRVGREHYPNVADFVEECLPAGTLITTATGLRPIETLAVGDRVLTHRGRYRPIRAVIRQQYTGQLISLKTAYCFEPLRVTPDHPVLRATVVRGRERKARHGCFGEQITDRSFVPARNIQVGDYLCIPIHQVERDRSYVTMTYRKKYPDYYAHRIRTPQLEVMARTIRALGTHPVRQRQHQLLERLCERAQWSFGDVTVVSADLFAYTTATARALGTLVDRGLLDRPQHNTYVLTEAGRNAAQRPYRSLSSLANELGVSRSSAHRLTMDSSSKRVFDITVKVPLAEELLTLIGYYLAEGSVANTTKNGKLGYWNVVEYSFGKGPLEQRYANEVQSAAQALGWTATRSLKAGCFHIIVHSRHLAQFLVAEFGRGAYHKHIPPWVIALPRSKLSRILDTYMNGDGHDYGTSRRGTTVSVNLAFGIAHLANRVGLRAGVQRGGGNNYVVGVYTHAGTQSFRDDQYVYVKVHSRSEFAVAGDVFNLEVAEDETFVTLSHAVHNCKVHGISRRLQSTLDFGRLSSDSRLLLVHDRAWNDAIALYTTWHCPKDLAAHHPTQRPLMCLGVSWEDVEGGDRIDDRRVRRTLPSVTYEARCRPDGLQPRYRPAFFLSVPCTQLALVAGTKNDTVLQAMQRASLPVTEVPF